MKKFILTILVLLLSITFSAYSQEKEYIYGWKVIMNTSGRMDIAPTSQHLYVASTDTANNILISLIDSSNNVTNIYSVEGTNECDTARKNIIAVYEGVDPYVDDPHFADKVEYVWFYDWKNCRLNTFKKKDTYGSGVEITQSYPMDGYVKDFCFDGRTRRIYYVKYESYAARTYDTASLYEMSPNKPNESELLANFQITPCSYYYYTDMRHYWYVNDMFKMNTDGNIWFVTSSCGDYATYALILIHTYSTLNRKNIDLPTKDSDGKSLNINFFDIGKSFDILYCFLPQQDGVYVPIFGGSENYYAFKDGEWNRLAMTIPKDYLLEDGGLEGDGWEHSLYSLHMWSNNELVIVSSSKKLWIYNLDTKLWREIDSPPLKWHIFVSNRGRIREITFWKGKQYVATDEHLYVYDVIDSTDNITDTPLPSFKVFPNPAKDLITITLAIPDVPSVVTISNEAGQEIFTQTIVNTQDIDISAFPTGVYFIKVDDYVEKLVVK